MAKNPRGCQIEAPLPADRVNTQKPFAVTGIDFAGPLYVKVGSNTTKSYIALLTCATTRAVHLELCTDMTTDKFYWHSRDSWEDEDCHILSTRTMRRHFTPPTSACLSYGFLCLQLKLTNSSPNTTLGGNILLQGRLGGNDSGRGWSGPRNAAYARY